jgi:hypothetical protein
LWVNKLPFGVVLSVSLHVYFEEVELLIISVSIGRTGASWRLNANKSCQTKKFVIPEKNIFIVEKEYKLD